MSPKSPTLYSRIRARSVAKTGKYISLPGVQRLRAMPYSLEEISNVLRIVGRHAVHKWRKGHARPTVPVRELLLKHFEIPMSAWMTAEEVQRAEKTVKEFRAGELAGKGARKASRDAMRMLGMQEAA